MKKYLYYYLFLSKSQNQYIIDLSNKIDQNNSHIIYDTKYDDSKLKSDGFFGLTRCVKQPSAWDKCFYFLHQNQDIIKTYDYFYIIEDDVYAKDTITIKNFCEYINKKTNSKFVTKEYVSKKDSKDWYWWQVINCPEFDNKYKSFNPFCRLSKVLINDILDYKNKNTKFLFHEILFASICQKMNYDVFDIAKDNEYKNYVENIRYRPIFEIKNIKDSKIYHPVKPNYETI